MVTWDLVPVLPDNVGCESEQHFSDLFRKYLLKNRNHFLTVFAVLFLLALSPHALHARHKCPKVPAPPGLMGISSSTTLIPSGSTMAAARSSETSGCDQGHPSKDFYKPQNKRVALFLKDNYLQIRQESAQGQGEHLYALALLAGCTVSQADFAKIIQENYVQVFGSDSLIPQTELTTNKADQASENLLVLMSDSPLLASRCESG